MSVSKHSESTNRRENDENEIKAKSTFGRKPKKLTNTRLHVADVTI